MVNRVINNRKQIKQKGFTLVEMMVVILIMSILLGATAWGVTGWIQHFTYIRNQETARYIYLGAQSGLSAYAGRGTLDEFFETLRNDSSGNVVCISDDTLKSDYGLPTQPDNRNKKHEYAYLKCDAITVPEGGIASNPILYDLVRPYLSDKESLDGSIIVELDMTAKKVYSAFYSSWAQGYDYGIENASGMSVRGRYAVYSEVSSPGEGEAAKEIGSRTEGMLSDYCVGYYDANQVNISDLKMPDNLHTQYVHLFNEETLHLDFRSDAITLENDTAYDLIFRKKTDDGSDPVCFVIEIDPSTVFSSPFLDHSDQPMTRASLTVRGSDGISILGDYDFYVSYRQSRQEGVGANVRDLSLILDAQSDGLTLAMLDVEDQVTGVTDKRSMSITRLMGDDPTCIYADVRIKPNPGGTAAYSAGNQILSSNVENNLMRTDHQDENDEDSAVVLNPGQYTVSYPRHLSNIRYAERKKQRSIDNGAVAPVYNYRLEDDLYWKKSDIYSIYYETGRFLTENEKMFATIPRLLKNSTLDGNGHAIYDLCMDNTSYIDYTSLRNGANGSVDTLGGLVNEAGQIGLFGENYGMIQRLVLRNADMILLSNAEKGVPVSNDQYSVYADNIHAAGIICGRDYGSMQEIYLDDECSLKATIYQMQTPDAVKGCGVGMLAGTVYLTEGASVSENSVHDRLRTGGSVEVRLGGSEYDDATGKPQFKKPNFAIGDDARGKIFDQEDGKKQYAYGEGGVFGYVYGDFDSATNLASLKNKLVQIGISEEAITTKAAKEKDEGGYFDKGYQKEEENAYKNAISLMKADANGLMTEADRVETANVFEDWTWSIENRAVVNGNQDITGQYFVGGIIGNIQMALAGDILQELEEEAAKQDGYVAIMNEKYVPQIINCRNYGSISGDDFVGGVVGVNTSDGYIADCSCYSDMKATKGVSAGITSENFGFIKNCSVDRASGDDICQNGYRPQITGNETVAGSIASVNHKKAVVMDCCVAGTASDELKKSDGTAMTDDDLIMVNGNDMKTIGYLVGINSGVVDGGLIGKYLGYSSDQEQMTIGGVVGINKADGVIQNIESSMWFNSSHAKYVGGIAGENNGRVADCIFSGSIRQPVGGIYVAGIGYGGIAAVNRKDAATDKPVITNCYLVGYSIIATGMGTFTAESTEQQIIDRSSAIGGVCGLNDNGAKITDCYVGAHYSVGSDGKPKADVYGNPIIDRQSRLEVKSGLIGGICGLNNGKLLHCGYTQKPILLQADIDKADEETLTGYKNSNLIREIDGRMLLSALCQDQLSDTNQSSMAYFDTAVHYMEIATPGAGYQGETFTVDPDSITGTEAWRNARSSIKSTEVDPLAGTYQKSGDDIEVQYREITAAASEKLKNHLMSDLTGELKPAAKAICGDLSDDNLMIEGRALNALPKKATPGDATHEIDAINVQYDDGKNTYVITSSDGTGNVGGITGYNSVGGSVEYCCSGKWLVETYHPAAQCTGTGGIAGRNTANGHFRYNMNFAYVRRELTPISDNTGLDGLDRYFHKYQYVGGVIGIQANETTDKWIVEGCANAGKVVEMFGNNASGVICQWTNRVGRVEECYNYGTLVTGYSDEYFGGYGNWNGKNGTNGTAGGVVGHMVGLKRQDMNSTINIISCQNHGIVNLPMRDYNFKENKVTGPNVIYAANDVGGVVGEVSVNNGNQVYVVNVEDCLNGESAAVIAHGSGSGIVGYVGGFSSQGGAGSLNADSVILNVKNSRNYSSELYKFGGKYAEAKTNYANNANYFYQHRFEKVGGIIAGLTRTTNGTGYLSLRHNLSLWMQDFNNIDNKSKIFKIGENASDANRQYLALCGYNFFIDEKSFQYIDYKTNNGSIDRQMFPALNNISYSERRRRDTTVAQSEGLVTEVAAGRAATVNAYNTDPISFVPTEWDRRLNANRLFGLTVSDGSSSSSLQRAEDHILTWEYGAYQVRDLEQSNGYLSDDAYWGEVVKQNITGQGSQLFGPVIAKFTENAGPADRTYDNNLAMHSNFKRAVLSENLFGSRMPFADEFDLDIYDLDRKYVRYTDKLNGSLPSPDNVINVDVKEDNKNGNYVASWDVVNANGNSDLISAEKFNVQITYYQLDGEFNLETFKNGGAYDGYTPVEGKTKEQIVSTKVITFIPPEGLDYTKNCYAVVRAKDVRGTLYSDVTEGTYTSFIKLKRKLKQPKFEIVEYQGNWVLHLLNPEDFADDINGSANNNFKVGAYRIDQGKNYAVSMGRSALTTDVNSQLLTNYTDCSTRFAIGRKDMVIQVYAEADDALASDYSTMTVYVPTQANPSLDGNMEYSYKGDGIETKEDFDNANQKPSYRTTLTYTCFDRDGAGQPIESPVAQVFRAELFGVVYDEETGKSWHETVAMKEYALNAGESVNVTLGYYDVPKTVNLKKYKSFDVEIWYASPGQGEVYQYTKTTSNFAANRRRATGYITDLSSGETLYYHRSVALPVPKLEITAYGDQWYLHLTNPEDFEEFKELTGFEIRAYHNKSNKNEWATVMTGDDIDLTDDGEGSPLKNAVALNTNYWSNSADNNQRVNSIFVAAQAEGMKSPKVAEGKVFVPRVTIPEGMEYGFVENDPIAYPYEDKLNDPDNPHFVGTFRFTEYGTDGTNAGKKDVILPADYGAAFVAEVYGARKDTGAHETIWRDEFVLRDDGTDHEKKIEISQNDLKIPDEGLAETYSELFMTVWYAGTGPVDTDTVQTVPVRTYFETTKERGQAHPDRISGYITDLHAEADRYYYHTAKLPAPRFEITTDDGKWYLHLLNPEDYDAVKDLNLKIGAYYRDNSKTYLTTAHKTEFSDPTAITVDTPAKLNNIQEIDTTHITGNAGMAISVYAVADGFAAADVQKGSIYLPKNIAPENFAWTLTATNDQLSAASPSYTGTLTYTNKGSLNGAGQVFRVELIGVRKQGGTEETLAHEDFTLSAGGSATVSFDTAQLTGFDASEYERLYVESWYASPGNGSNTVLVPVRTYYETTEEFAVDKKRNAGFITDVSSTFASSEGGETRYYHYLPKLPAPEFEILRLKRAGNWFAHLLNKDEFGDIPAVIKVYEGNTEYSFSLADDPAGNPVPIYGVEMVGTDANRKKRAVATADGYFSSEFVFDDTNSNTRLKTGVDGWHTYVNLYRLKEEKLELSEDGKLSYHGILSATAHRSSEAQFMTTEIYAKDKDGNDVTLYLNMDQYMNQGTGNWTLKDYPVDISLQSDLTSGFDLRDYSDFRLTIWWSAMRFSANEKRYFRSYVAIDEEIAKQNNYRRDKGILTFVGGEYKLLGETINGGTADAPVYYYAAPLYDPAFYGDKGTKVAYTANNNNDPDSPLRIDSSCVIAKILTAEQTREDGDDTRYVTYTVSNDIGAENVYRIRKRWYRTPKGVSAMLSEEGEFTVSGNGIEKTFVGENVDEDTKNDILVGKPALADYDADYLTAYEADGGNPLEPEFDENQYDYYEVIDIVDFDIAVSVTTGYVPAELLKAYGKSVLVKLTAETELPTPEVTINRIEDNANSTNGNTAYRWFLHLNNPEDYYVDGDTGGQLIMDGISIICSLYGNDYTIDLEQPSVQYLDNGNTLPFRYVSDPISESDGSVTQLECYAKTDALESEHVLKNVYLPSGGDEKEPGAKIVLSGDAKAVIDQTAGKVTVTGSMSYTGVTNPPAMLQRFRIALVNDSNGAHPKKIWGYTTNDADIQVNLNGESANLNTEFAISGNITKGELKKCKVYVFYLHNSWEDETVTHYTKLGEGSADQLKKSPVFLDMTNDEGNLYFSRALSHEKDDDNPRSDPALRMEIRTE